MTATEPRWADYGLLKFRHYVTGEGFEIFEARRSGMDSPDVQMKELRKFMSKMVPDKGDEIVVDLTVRHLRRNCT